jgi:hypothetical protein
MNHEMLTVPDKRLEYKIVIVNNCSPNSYGWENGENGVLTENINFFD